MLPSQSSAAPPTCPGVPATVFMYDSVFAINWCTARSCGWRRGPLSALEEEQKRTLDPIQEVQGEVLMIQNVWQPCIFFICSFLQDVLKYAKFWGQNLTKNCIRQTPHWSSFHPCRRNPLWIYAFHLLIRGNYPISERTSNQSPALKNTGSISLHTSFFSPLQNQMKLL